MGRYNIHAGHCQQGQGASGASGILQESVENRKVKNRVISALQKVGHTVYDCTDDSNCDANTNLSRIVQKCNAHEVELDVSIHLNAGGGHGVEVWCYDGGTAAVAQSICNNVAAKLGLRNRGVKYTQDFYVLNSTSAPALLVECCFVDSAEDAGKWNAEKCGDAIASAILGKAVQGDTPPASNPTPVPKPPAQLKNLGQVDAIYQVFTNKWWDAVKNRTNWAGAGDGIPIRYLALRVSKGSIKYRVHSVVNGWLGWISACNIGDLNNGCAGDGTPIDAVQIYYYTPAGYEYKSAVYRVSDTSSNEYYPDQYDDKVGPGLDGHAGVFGIPVDKLQVSIE